jgi:hypothetical protein
MRRQFVGLPGDTIEMREQQLIVNSQPFVGLVRCSQLLSAKIRTISGNVEIVRQSQS